MRVVDGPGGTRTLEIAVRSFVQEEDPGLKLSFVGVTHIGTGRYYEQLQERLDAADLVLFEGVGGDMPEFREADPEEVGDGIQPALARALGLEYQLFAIDYTRKHFVNSDMTPLEFFAILAGEDVRTLSEEGQKRLMETMAALQGEGLGGQMLRMMMAQVEANPVYRGGLSWAMVEILGTLQGDITQMQGLPPDMQEMMEILIRQRNDVVVRDVADVFARETPPKHVMIFYGAAHMHDLEERIVAAHGLKEVDTQWLPAFSGNLEASGIGRTQRRLFQWFVDQQLQTMRMMMR